MKFKVIKSRELIHWATRARKSKPVKLGMYRMKCNLCHGFFRAASKFFRFCRTCRAESEVYRFSGSING
jgi:hypothetical protein